MYRRMTSRFPGKCPKCSQRWLTASIIMHSKTDSPRTVCKACGEKFNENPELNPQAPKPPKISFDYETPKWDQAIEQAVEAISDYVKPKGENVLQLTGPYRLAETEEGAKNFAMYKKFLPSLTQEYYPETHETVIKIHHTDALKMAYHDDVMDIPAINREKHIKEVGFKNPGEESDFKGGTLKQLQHVLEHGADTSKHEKTFQEWGPKFALALEEVLGNSVKRRNIRDEFDGECLDLEHALHSERPYTSRRRILSTQPRMTLNVYIGANCFVDSDTLDKYGRILWALVQTIEQYGVFVEINTIDATERFHNEYKGDKRPKAEIITRVKNSDEYLAPSTLANYLSCNYFRRVTFAQICMAASCAGHTVDYALGATKAPNFSVEPGVINLSLGTIEQDSETVIQRLREAISQ